MKELLFLSFDLIREGEADKSLSIASNLAFLKNQPDYGFDLVVKDISFNMFEVPKEFSESYFLLKFQENKICFRRLDTVAISAYIWCEHYINDLISLIRKIGFCGKIVLGGYQISYSSRQELEEKYPDADIFISGYGEKALLKSLNLEKQETKYFLSEPLSFEEIPSVYLTGEVKIADHQKMVRIETKRGCPYRCSFCAHRDLLYNKVYKCSLEKIYSELSFLNEKKVQRINVLDPVFNIGGSYMNVLDELNRIQYSGEITFQTRFENIENDTGKSFLDKVERLNAVLEFGVQTIIEAEFNAIGRTNKMKKILKSIEALSARKIPFEISLIYGLPNQTLDSFRRSIDFALKSGSRKVHAYPLMLLRGTELFLQKEKYALKERNLGEFNIPVVVQSSSFSEEEYFRMKELADSLDISKKERV